MSSLPPGSDVRPSHGFHMATRFTAPLSGLSPSLSLLGHPPYRLPPPNNGLWHHLDNLCTSLFLSVMNQKPTSRVCTRSISQQRGRQSKQTGSKFANLFSFDDLQRVFHSRLNMFSERSRKRLVCGRCSCGKDLHNSSKATAS